MQSDGDRAADPVRQNGAPRGKNNKEKFTRKRYFEHHTFPFVSLAGAVLILTVVSFLNHVSVAETLTLDLSLVIAGIPISLPAVMTLVIEYGVLGLAKRNAIVRRISALEDFANVNLVLTDKTGTLTKNEITIKDVIAYAPFSRAAILLTPPWPHRTTIAGRSVWPSARRQRGTGGYPKHCHRAIHSRRLGKETRHGGHPRGTEPM